MSWSLGARVATRMAWMAITRAFLRPIEVVMAGTDGANTACVAVMRRLRMRFRRAVSYPLGPAPNTPSLPRRSRS